MDVTSPAQRSSGRSARPPIDRRLLSVDRSVAANLIASGAVGVATTIGMILQAIGLARLLSSALDVPTHSVPLGAVWLVVAGLSAIAVAAGVGPIVTTMTATAAGAALFRRATASVADPAVLRTMPEDRTEVQVLCTKGVDATSAYLAQYFPALVVATAAPCIVLVWLAVTDLLSAAIVVATVVVLPIFMVLLGRAAASKMDETWDRLMTLTRHFADVVAGMRTLRSFNREARQLDVLAAASAELTTATMATVKVALLSSFALELLSSIATALVAVGLGIRLASGSISLSVALAILIVTPEAYLPLRRASAQFHEAADGVAAAASLLDLADLRTPPKPPIGAPSTTTRPVALTFTDVTVELADRPTPIGPLSFSAPAGTVTWLDGPSGVGKSTVFSLLLNLIDPDSGVITVDGRCLGEGDAARWRTQIAWLPQHPTFPGRSVADALAMRAPDTSGSELLALSDELGLLHLLERPGFLDAPPHQALREVSTGERRRLALMRTLLGPRRLTLLDEPLAHLDEPSQCAVLGAISRRCGASTVIIASHHDLKNLPIDLHVHLERVAQ